MKKLYSLTDRIMTRNAVKQLLAITEGFCYAFYGYTSPFC